LLRFESDAISLRLNPQYTVFFDLETGGLLDDHPDIQLAAVAVLDQNLTTVGEFQEKIRFDINNADPEALRLNHFDPAVWERESIPEADAVIRFADFISQFKCVHNISKRTGAPYLTAKLAGHNAATFDMPRLRRMFRRGNYTFLAADPRVYDTDEHGELVMQLDTYATNTPGEDPARKTVPVDLRGCTAYKVGVICAQAATRNIVVRARVSVERPV
jgi:hypothetical protein